MQNFTLGKKGISMLLFGLVLLIGSVPSYGQSCPTVIDPDQDFCALATVAELQATDTGDGVSWYDDQTSTSPIPLSENLENGKIYFAGTNVGTTCQGSRDIVTATVTDIGEPTFATNGEDEFFTPCERSAASPGAKTIGDLRAGIQLEPFAGYTIEYFADQLKNSAELADSFLLLSGTSYFAGYVSLDKSCQSSRLPLRYEPIVVDAPTGPAAQTVCFGTTLSQLEASGTNRWYRTATSNPQISGDPFVQDGMTYYATLILPSDGPPCESSARLAVTVTVEGTTPIESTQSFCESIGSGNNFDRPRVKNLVAQAANPIWFADAGFTQQLDPEDLLEDTEDYFTADSENCIVERIVVQFFDTPNAGSTTQVSFCSDAAPVNLVDSINNSQLGAPDQTGTFSPNLVNNIFDPAAFAPGSHTFTYRVEGNINCPTDISVITVTVVRANAGQDGIAELNTADSPVNLFDFLGTPDAGGTFSPGNADGSFDPATGASGDYTYTVNNGTCIDTSKVTVTILDAQDCPIVTNTTQEFCESIGTGNNFDLPRIEDLEPAGATWYLTAVSADSVDSQTALTDGDIFFAGNADGTCTNRTEVTVIISDSPNSGSTTFTTTCANANPFNLVDRLNPSILGLADRDGVFSPALSTGPNSQTFNPEDYVPGNYTFNYNTGSKTNCPDDTAVIRVTVQTIPNAGTDTDLVICSADIPGIIANPGQFAGLLPVGVDTNGTFDPTLPQLIALFTANPMGTFTTTYTVTNANCSNSAVYSVTTSPSPNAGEDGSIEVPRTDASFNLFTELEGSPVAGGIWSPGNTNGSFDPATGDGGVYTYTVTNGACEDTAIVTVAILNEEGCPIVEQTLQIFCESISDANGNNPRRPRVSDLIPAGVIWYAETDSETALPANTILANGITYFAGNSTGTCELRTPVLVTIDDSPNAGATTRKTVCADDDPFDLLDVFNESILGVPDAGGVVTPPLASGTTLFDPSIDLGRQYRYTVQSENETCLADFAFITINILVNEDANAGIGFPLEFCVTNEDVNLFDELADDVTMTGTFSFEGEDLIDGIFSPSTSGEGEFPIIYTVGEDLSCVAGADSAIITITVNAVPEAPVADNPPFCLVDNKTVADLVATGDNIVWYEDEDLTIVAPATTILEHGDVYYAVATGDNSCSSPSTMVTITMNDSDAPTLPTGDNEFCRSDNPTIQDLLDNINGSGIQIYSSLTGGTAIATTTALQDGVQYFATATTATSSCESSERLAIRVEVAFCGIPEGFSPNGDNINDRFVIPEIAINYPNYNIEIYNRWGNMVFKGNASTPDWDGISNKSGTLGDGVLPVGVYFYILNYNDGATASEQGKLYLSR